MRILFIGDLVGRAGMRLLQDHLHRLVDRENIDYVVCNVENAADGLGVTPELAEAVLGLGVHCLTSGNHIWDKREIRPYLERQPRLLRPINYPEDLPGRGTHVGETASGRRVAVVNVMGRVFMPAADEPFRRARAAVERLRREADAVVVDVHAEATSEKIAMGWHLDGLASAVVGTHTHVQTADERLLPGGTAYITDVGMTGPYDSIIGMEKTVLLERFINCRGGKPGSAKNDPILCAVVIDVEEAGGRARSIRRLAVPGAP